ncbi:glycoside hydrolase family 127 protein [Gryllotalpicola ginsengisoli]|uniref:glycoside hydrolase family 127 protein n=1 Tax=Gryllotalpicola ginsengisoli TaxID=444608 RepID=UPI0003B781CD|nr:beta-L-arabinofuranosidase domain-containing protein [Gryllotalpicola ginsengisoli]
MTIVSSVRPPASPTGVSTSALGALQPLGIDVAHITGGWWAGRQRRIREVSIPDGRRQLEEAGNLDNFRIAGGSLEGEIRGPVFADSDVYKWLEAAAWEYGRQPDEGLLAEQLEITALVAAAQEDDGYVNTVIQIRGDRYRNPARDHEHYCAGHLFQAAVAQSRCTGHDELLEVAIRFADHLVRTFGAGRREDVDGHPVVEMGLVELYRQTGRVEYLDLARYFVEARGHALTTRYGGNATYLSDRVPVREAATVEGHAVRAVYLAAGAADVAVETGDEELLRALDRQFASMTEAKQYVTGGLGARWEGEAFGDPYELPADRAYAETCAGIGAVQWAWRMLLATAEPRYADQIEHLLYNAVMPGVSLGGDEYFYVNTLHLRDGAEADNERSAASGRRRWFDCACCPPNVMRTLAQLGGYLATVDERGLQLQQYAPSRITGALADGEFTVAVQTDYPWKGAVRVTVEAAPGGEADLALRIPAWAEGATVDGQAVEAGSYAHVRRVFNPGDVVELELPLQASVVTAHPRVDAVRGSVAVRRGPLVYAIEQADQPDGVVLDDLRVDPDANYAAQHRPDLLGGVTTLSFPAVGPDGQRVQLTAIPYFAWANRGIGPMRVWIPTV